MRLRRVIEHVRMQEWTEIWIDLVIVMVGVFIGIQVTNWNKARQEDQRARGFIERLSNDLDQELASINKGQAYVGRSIANCESALAWAEDGKSLLAVQLGDGSTRREIRVITDFFDEIRRVTGEGAKP